MSLRVVSVFMWLQQQKRNGNGVLNGGVSFLFRIRQRLVPFYPEPVLLLFSNPKILCPQAGGEAGELRQGLLQLALSSFIVDVPLFLFSQAASGVTPAYTSIYRIAPYKTTTDVKERRV